MAEAQGNEAEAGREEEEGSGEELAAPAPDTSGRDIVADTVSVLARALVEHPDDVRVTEVPSDRGPRYRLDVHPDDVGRVIGRGGHIARSIRQVTRAAAARAGISVYLEIGD